MAWNIPGGSGNGRNPRRGNGSFPERVQDAFRGLFGGGGDGGNAIARWVGVVVVLWLAVNCFVLVTEQQRGVVLRFGQFSRILQPGPHLKWPWPVERVAKVQATQIKTFSDTVPVLTRDENIVTVEVNVQYRVDDPREYLFGSRDADAVLQQATLSAVREQVGRSDLDTVLSARSALSVSARVRTVAEGYKSAAIDRATGDATRFSLLLDQYKAAPDVTRKRLWLETVQQVLAGNRVIVGGDGKQLIYLPMPAAGGASPASTGSAAAPAPEFVAPAVDATAAGVRPGRDARPDGREGREEATR
jgi:membrane protease subunit HflK